MRAKKKEGKRKRETNNNSNCHLLTTFYALDSGGGLVDKSCPPLLTPWTVACQAPLCKEFPRQEYWSGLPFPFLGDLPDSGIEPGSPALAGGFFPTEPPGKVP